MNDTSLFGVDEKMLSMELERNIRSLANKVQSSPSANKSTPDNPNQGIATLLVMIAVLTIIIMFCCFSAPGIRGLCKKYIFRSCPYDDPDVDNASSTVPETSTPTVILLPHGRMLVVDRAIFNQLQADQSGIDLLELSEHVMRNQRDSTSSETSKGLSPVSLGFGPPTYEDIFGDLPPSYSEVSLMMKRGEELREVTVDRVCDSSADVP